MLHFPGWLWILLIVGLLMHYFDYVRRLAKKDRRIEELEHLLSEYRSKTFGIIDVDDVRKLLPEPGVEGPENAGVDLKIDV